MLSPLSGENENIMEHTTESLWQVEGANLVEGGCVDGGTWFGSIPASVELMQQKKIYSTFIIKNNKQYFPMEVLQTVLLALDPD